MVINNERLVLSLASLRAGLDVVKQLQAEANVPKANSLKDVVADEFERRLLAEVVPPEEVGVDFDDIG